MSPERRSDGGLPRSTHSVSTLPRRAEEHWAGANQAKAEKLRGRSLQRRAGANGFELRHSAYGYSIVDSARNLVDGRNDLSLDEVESWLDGR